jgi:polysaccharide deacetylase family protein (PEP-CTERM system associated)
MGMMNLLTVDLEDWFHICEVEHLLPREKWDRFPSTVVTDTEKLLSLVAQTNSRATFFVLGYVAEKHPDLVRRIYSMGHEIGYHGWDHELVYDLNPQEFRLILRRGIECIAGLIDKRPIGFRAEEGFVYDSSLAPLKIIGNESYPRTPWKMKTAGGDLWELPPLTLKTPFGHYPAGGSWGLRLLPYPLLKHRVRQFNQRQLPTLFYFHPREFGGKKVSMGLPLSKKFALYGGFWGSETQLVKLLADFRFTSIEEYISKS